MLTRITGNVAYDAAKQLSQGQKASVKTLLMQPKNVEQIATKLSELRGAAMKVGQLISMDSGDLLPPSISHLLNKLRSNAEPMPHKQLLETLRKNWGDNWLDQYSHFELRPFAAASIGQVHIAYRENGEKLAVKIQYPGIAKSINSDVDNVAMLLKLSGLLPKHIQLDQLLDEAKAQLLIEADYIKEARFIDEYRQFVDDDRFVLPVVCQKYSNESILVMRFMDGVPIESIKDMPQLHKNKVVSSLFQLFFDELFTHKIMQTDPNFANYLYQQDTGKVALLDFGATRRISSKLSQGYLNLIATSLQNDKEGMQASAREIGFFAEKLDDNYLNSVLTIFRLACEPLLVAGEYDFAKSDLALRIKQHGLSINEHQEQWHTPPIDALFIHRKIVGLYLLATTLGVQVNVRSLFEKFQS